MRLKGHGVEVLSMNELYDAEYCYECQGYGDDYIMNEDGELECCCFQCPFSPYGEMEGD